MESLDSLSPRMFWPSMKIKSVKISREKKQLVAEKKKKAARNIYETVFNF